MELPTQLYNFLLVKRIGEGGYGEVYKAYNVVNGIPVAIKLFRPPSREIFLSEISSNAYLSECANPKSGYVVCIYGAGEYDVNNPKNAAYKEAVTQFSEEMFDITPSLYRGTRYFIVQELMDTDLSELIDFFNRDEAVWREFYIENSKYLVAMLLRGLKDIHQSRVAHQDIKPANILLRVDEEVELLDCLISLECMREHVIVKYGDLGLVCTNLMEQIQKCKAGEGTLNYLAPEDIRDIQEDVFTTEQAQKKDLWSLGMTLYELFFGENLLFDEDEGYAAVIRTFESITQEDVDYKLDDKVIDLVFRDVLGGLLQVNPADRKSTSELLKYILPFEEEDEGVVIRVDFG